MTKLGKTALAFTVLALIGGFVLASMLGKYHNEWSVSLSNARQKSEAAIADHKQAAIQLEIAQAELARTKMGWGYEWELGGADAPQVRNGALFIQNVGANSNVGLTVKNVLDEQGQNVQVPPVVHVFAGTPQNTSAYIGEFIADPQQLTANSCVLIPTWNVTPQEIGSWDFSNGARFRSQIPPAERAAVEGANQLVQRLREGIAQTNRNIAEQQALLASVQEQLEFRKRELLGNPDLERIDERPEYSDGLVKAIVDIEEQRNELQVAVDVLRRSIKQSADERDDLVAQLNSLIAQLPQPEARVTQKP
jgi:hypothetical protein